jgi:hypothetical protein
MSQTHVQLMWALGKGQTEGKFYILSIHQQAMQKAQALEPVSNRTCLLNPNQTSELIMNSDSKQPHCNVTAKENEKCNAKVLLEPNLQWQSECTVSSSTQGPLGPDINFSSSILYTKGMELTGWKKIMTDYGKYITYLKF